MSSKKRSRSVSGNKHSLHEGLLALHGSPTSEARFRGNQGRTRLRSVSRPPTGRVPLDRDTDDKTRPSEPKSRFPASFEKLADPQFQSPPRVHTPPSKPVKGILKDSSSPIRPSSASSLTNPPTSSVLNKDFRSRDPFYLRAFSSLDFSPVFKDATPTGNSAAKLSPIPVSRTTNMSGKASGKVKPRDATAVHNLGPSGPTDNNKKPVPVNGSKAIDTSDEGSSSSDEESSESSDSSDEESTASEKELKTSGNAAAPAAAGKKTATATASESSESESESESSDESDDDTTKQKAKSPPAVTPAATNGDPASSTGEDSDSETGSGGAKVAASKEVPNSSTESSEEDEEEDSDEEMDDAPSSGQASGNTPKPPGVGTLNAAQRAAPEPPPSVMDGGFKLQKAQNLGQMASLLSEANAKGDRVWLLTHPSTTPLNLEVQQVFTSSENHRNSIVPNGTKLTYPIASEGSNIHTICKFSPRNDPLRGPVANPTPAGCAGITVTKTMRHEGDISSFAQVMSDVRHAKEAPTQPAGLRNRYLPIGVGRASPTLEDSPASTQPRASEKPKKEKKKGKKESSSSSQPEPSTERPHKKRKVSPMDEAESSGVAVKGKSKKTQGSSQPAVSDQAEPDTEKPKKKKSKKSKAEEAQEEAQEETPAKASKKHKVKFAADEAPRTSTPIPPPSIPSSQPQETPSKKKKRRLSSEGEPSSEKSEKKGKKDSAKKQSAWSRPEEVKVTPVAPPSIPGMR